MILSCKEHLFLMYAGSGATYTMNLNPHTNPARIKIKVAEGAAASSSTGERNQRSTQEILFRPPVMKESNLALYFPLGEEVNATKASDWGPYGLTGEISGNPGRLPGKTGSSIRFDGSANKKILIRNHRAMRMNNGGQYTANIWLRYEVSSSAWGSVFERKGRNYYFTFGENNNANGGYVHHRYRMGNNTNAGVTNALSGIP